MTRYLCAAAVAGVMSVGSAGPAAGEREQSRRRDRGDLAMRLGDVEWKATRCRAEIEGDELVISASRLDGRVTQGQAIRQSIELRIGDYAGPGSYTIPGDSAASLFLVVGISAGDAETPEGMDAAMVEALTRAKHVVLAGAKVSIESADEAQITGTFSWDGGTPAISEGKFRALIRR